MSTQENKRYPFFMSFWVWKVSSMFVIPMTVEQTFEWFGRLSDLFLTDSEFLDWVVVFYEAEDMRYAWRKLIDYVVSLFGLIRSGKREDLRAKLKEDWENVDLQEYEEVEDFFKYYKAYMRGEAQLLEKGADSFYDDAACSEEDEEYISEFFVDELDSGGEFSDENDPAYSEEDVDDSLMFSDDEYDDDYSYEDEDYGSDDGIQYDEYEESGVDLF